MSFDYTGSFSGSFSGEIVASNGVISASNQVNFTQVQNKPTTISAFQKNSIAANANFRENTYPTDSASFGSRITGLGSRISTLETATDETGSDSQTLSFNQVSNNLTISDGNTVNLSSLAGAGGGGGSSIWSTGSDYYYVSSDLQVTGSFKVTQNVTADSFTGSLQGTADTASFISDTFISASAVRSGFGAGGGSSTDISALNTFTGSIQTEVTTLTAATSSYLTSVPSGTLSGSAQVETIIDDTYISASAAASGFGAGGGVSVPDGTISSSAQVDLSQAFATASNALTASFVQGVTFFDGDRTVSNTNLPSGIYNNNFGTSGSISAFIEKVFFPNSVPVITSHGFTIEEFEISGSSVGTVSATDAEGQSFTYRTASSYTADKFRIASNGAITLNTKSTASLNTDNTPGSGSHPFQIEAVDTFNGVGSRTLYIRVNPNTAPKFRQTSVAGSIITAFTQSLNEDSVAGNNKVRVFFTDDENDTITINTGSLSSDFSSKFSLDIESTYVQLNQTTSSLDFEDITQFEFVLTASDQHYQDGDDTLAVAYLPFQVAVVDNVGPSVNDQTLSGVNENSTNGAGAGSIVATDPESNTITFTNFTLQSANLDGGGDIKGTLNEGAGNLYDPTRDPFQCSTAGVVTRKDGIFLNSDIANNYVYQVTVADAFNTTTDTALITIPIADDSAASITDNWDSLHIMESVGENYYVRKENGILGLTGTFAQLSSAGGSVIQRWEVSSTGDMIKASNVTGSATYLQANQNISGSIYTSGSIIAVAITASEHAFETTKQYFDYTIKVEPNSAPDMTFTNTSANLNTNGGRSGSLLTTIGFSDTEGDALAHDTFTFTDPSGQLNSVKSGDSYLIQAKNNLSGSTDYGFTASIQDIHGFRTNTEEHEITIAQSAIGTLSGDTTSFIISTAVSGTNLQDLTGEGNGNASALGVTYSPNYNSQAVASFTSSRQGIFVDSSGNLTAGYDFSGSVTSTDYTSTALVSDSTNSTLYGKSLHVNGIKVVQGAATGSQSAVPDAFTEKVAQTIKLMVTSSGADINDTDQANMIGILKGETGTWHSGYPTAQRILRGAGSDYSPNPLIGSNYSSYSGLQDFQDSHATDDMIWYLNSSAASGSGDADIVEVIEHLMHTIHQYGVRGAVSGSYYGLSWDPDTDSNWNTRELYYAIKEAVDDSVFDISDYGDASYNTASTFKLIAKEYLYLLNFNMWEYSSLWSGGSLSPEWNDNSRTPSGIQTNNPLGYALYNKYIKPVLTKPSKTVLQNIFQDGDVGDPTAAGSSGYTPEVGTGLISKITFRDQYDNIGSGSVNVTVFNPNSLIFGKVYVYDVGYNIASFATAVGRSSQDGSTPPVATPFSGGFMDAIQDDNVIGDDSFQYTFGSLRTATLLASGSGTNVHNVLRAMGSSGNITRSGNTHFLVLMPSGSEMSGIPTSVRDSYGGSTLHEYVLEVGVDGTTVDGTNTLESSQLNQIDLGTNHLGFTTWFMVGASNQVTSTSTFNLGLSPSSGSGGA